MLNMFQCSMVQLQIFAAIGFVIIFRWMGLVFAGQDCEYMPWMPWTKCTANCSGGIKTRHRVLQVPVSNETCPGAEHDIATCNEEPCPINCLVSAWRHWTPCDCESKMQNRTRGVLQKSEHQGNPCPESLETRNCSCPIDCRLTRWSDWGLCSATCGQSVSLRNRSIVMESESGGKPCPDTNETRICILPACASPDSQCYGLKDGNYRDPNRKCSFYFISCTNQETEWRRCPDSLVFDPQIRRCEQFERTKECSGTQDKKLKKKSATDWRFRWSSLFAMIVILLLMIAFLVRVVLWDVPCC